MKPQNILAYNIGGGDMTKFVDMMNEKAAELGCTGTHFANTHGLSQEDHYVTAHDLYLIYQAALQYSLFTEISSSTQYTIAANETHPAIQLENTNQLLDEDGKYYCSEPEFCSFQSDIYQRTFFEGNC